MSLSSRTFQSDDFAGRIHDGTVGRDGPPDRVGGVGHVHNHHLVLLAHLLSDADELVRLHGEVAEPDVGWVHAHVLQLETRGGVESLIDRLSIDCLEIEMESKMRKMGTVCCSYHNFLHLWCNRLTKQKGCRFDSCGPYLGGVKNFSY